MNVVEANREVLEELKRAETNFGNMVSPHEGFAIIKEEVDELWEEVRKAGPIGDRVAMKEEARHVAAMALRFLVDIC